MDKVCPVITLDNGIRIANWSSPHEFKFTTGEILPACSPERAKAMSLDIDETVVNQEKWDDIVLDTNIPDSVYEDIEELKYNDEIDIILVPFMVLDALKSSYPWIADKCRVIRVADRVTKEIYPDKFCI
jgi:hypothetical protein